VPVPELFLHNICDHHDFNYWIGHTEKDRQKADMEFYQAGKRKAGWNLVKQATALTYYLAVRAFGSTCFHYADKERDEADLEAALKELICKTSEAN
jgi:hypothetical protein